MIMFTPMNGRAIYQQYLRMKRDAIHEFLVMDKRLKSVSYTMKKNKLSHVLSDAITFYLHSLNYQENTFDAMCQKRAYLIDGYDRNSQLVKITVEEIINGIFVLQKQQPMLCVDKQ